MCLLAGPVGIIGALLCTSDFLHPRHSTAPCIMQNASVFHNFSNLDVDHTNTYPAGADVNFQPSGGSVVPAKIALATGAGAPCHAPCQACSQSCQTSCQTPKPRVQPNLLPGWQPSLQQSPFLWPLLSMCSSSESNTPAIKSGTWSLFLCRAEHTSQQAVPGPFCGSYAFVSA